MIIRFLSDNTTARVEGRVPVHVLEAIERRLTYIDPKVFFTPAYKFGRDDGKRCLLDTERQEFPVGLEAHVLEVLDQHLTTYQVRDERPVIGYDPVKIDTVSLKGVTLYKEQVEALHAFFESGARGCLECPTGFGKTEVMAAILKLVKKPALVLIDSKSLVAQTAKRLELRLGEPVGIFRKGDKRTARIVVSTIQGIWYHFAKLRKSFLKNFDVLIVDECHKISPNTWFKILREVPARIRCGLSATIKEASRRMVIESYLGPIVHEAQVSDMIEDGRAARPTIKMLRLGGIVRGEDPASIYESGIVTNDERNRVIRDAVDRCIQNKIPSLVLVVRIEHGYRIQKLLEERGWSVPFLHGLTPLDEIVLAKKRFGTARVPAIIASTIFDLGQDIPEIRALILAGGQRSPLRTIQRVGRSLRAKHTGENTVLVMDFFDMGHRMLQNQSDERRRTFKRKYDSVTLVGSLDEIFAASTPTARTPRTPVA